MAMVTCHQGSGENSSSHPWHGGIKVYTGQGWRFPGGKPFIHGNMLTLAISSIKTPLQTKACMSTPSQKA